MMDPRHSWKIMSLLLGIGLILLAPKAKAVTAPEIIEATGIEGGLVVHVGCGDGRLTAALHLDDRYLVHGLDADAENVERAREYIRSLGLYGSVSVEQWSSGVLPYNDNQVNLLVVERSVEISDEEIMRVLCPNGVAYVRKDGEWVKKTKPWPEAIDEWTHFLHDADGNAVAKDRLIDTPRHLQWEADPKRTRDHDAEASFSAMTSSRGRIFYILDEGPTSMIHRPAEWRLIARDAFNGKLLWKRDIDSWSTYLRYFRSGPVQLPRRLVSIGDRVYVTLGIDAPITVLDAATGQTLQTYAGSENTEEFICDDGILLAVIGDPHVWNRHAPKADNYWDFYAEEEPQTGKSIVAFDVRTGKQLWRKAGENLAWLAPLSLTAGGGRVLFLDNANLYCAELDGGKDLWNTPFPTKGLFLRNYAPTVLQHKDTVVCLSLDRLVVFSLDDGRPLWEDKGYAGFASAGDVFVINDVVWTLPGTQAIHVKPEDVPGGGEEFLGFDLYTGEVRKSFVKEEVWPGGHHHRCYRNKATQRFLICGRRGLEFVDVAGNDHVINWWVRGVCQYGIMPANGIIYSPSTPCQCFNLMKFDGFHALAASNSLDDIQPTNANRLEKGPAYTTLPLPSGEGRGEGNPNRPRRLQQTTPSPPSESQNAGDQPNREAAWSPPVASAGDDWPTYRHDISRSGCATTSVPVDLQRQWAADVGGRLSGLVVADDRLFVSSIDRNTLHCLDAATGEPVWRFVAGGRIDSPPTVFDRMAIFGSSDGYVQAVRADNGQLIWRFRGAPVDRRIVVRDRLESVWPIHGAVLVQDGVVYFAAGRTSFLDGGIRLYGLDARTGRLLHQAAISTEGKSTTGALPDVLVSDGTLINMRHVQFDSSLIRQEPTAPKTIFSPTGLLEDCWAHRLNWCLGLSKPVPSGANALSHRSDSAHPFGKLIVFDGQAAYGAQNHYTFLKYDEANWPATHTGHLHQKYARYTPDFFPIGTRLYAQANRAAPESAESKQAKKGSGFVSTAGHAWTVDAPLQIRAMVLAGDRLFAAGWHDAVGPGVAGATAEDNATVVLWTLSTTDGRQLSEFPLATRPVFDGMAAAYGRLYLATAAGQVLCLGK